MSLQDIRDIIFFGISVRCNCKGMPVLMDVDNVKIVNCSFKISEWTEWGVYRQIVFNGIWKIFKVKNLYSISINIMVVFKLQSFLTTVGGVHADVMALFDLFFCNLVSCIYNASCRKTRNKWWNDMQYFHFRHFFRTGILVQSVLSQCNLSDYLTFDWRYNKSRCSNQSPLGPSLLFP